MSTQTILIIAGVVLILLLLMAFNNRGKKSVPKFYSIYTINGLQFVQRLEQMIENNESIPHGGGMRVYHQMFGDIPADDYEEFTKAVGISGYLDEPEESVKSIAGDYLATLLFDLGMRYNFQYQPLQPIGESEAMEKYNLNIHNNEFIYHSIGKVDWYEEKTITTSYSYGGFQYKLGGKGGLSYRMGNLHVTPNTTQQFIAVDRGTIYVTNKRLIFVGKQNRVNKSIDLNEILEFSIFRDGVLIGKSNGKKPLVIFSEWIIKPNTAPNKRDDLNIFIRVLDRILRQNQSENLTESDLNTVSRN